MNELSTLGYEEIPLNGKLVAFVTLRRAHINVRMIRDLESVCDHLEDTSQADVVVFQSDGPSFCEGIDFADFAPDKSIDIHGFNKWEKIAVRLERLPKATVALVGGPAIGGGFQLALVMDQRLATPRAVFQLPEVHLGFLPGMATFRLAKYVGLGTARRLMLCAERVGAEEAARLGLVDRVVEDLEQALGEVIARFGPVHNVAVELCRRLLNESFSTDHEDALGHFLAAQHRAVTQTAFLETLKREREG